TFSELAQNWLGGFAGSLPLGVSQIGTTQAGLTVQPTIGNEAIGQTDKQGRTIVNITPMENTYAVSYMDETGKVDGMVLTPDKFKEYLQKNFPQIKITPPETTPEIELLTRKKEYLVEQNEQINERLEELEDRGQMGTDLYNKLENQREQNGKAIQELTAQINTLQQSLPQPVETPKVEEEAKKQGQIFYHGTNQLFSHFEEGVSDSSGAGVSNAGVFLTEDKESANWWAKYAALEGGTPNVKEVFADVKNTKVFKTRQSFENFIDKFDTPEEAVEYLKKQGYDSISYPENIAETFSPEYFDTLSRQLGKTFGPLHKTTRVLQVFDPKNVYILKEGKKQITTIQDIYRNKRQKEQLFKQKFGPFIDKAKESPNLQAFLGKLSTNEFADLFNAVQRGDIEGVNSMQDFYNQAVKGAKQETRTELQPKQIPPPPVEPQPVVEKTTPAVEEKLPETTSFAINQALLRLAKQQGIPIDQLPPHEVENIKQTVKATTDWYNSLTPEQKDAYITSGQLPPNISKPIFADLYSKEAIKGDTTKQRLLLESPIYQELTEAGRLLREQKEVVDSTVEVVKTVQEAKKQRAKKLLGVEPEIASQRTQKRLLNEINLKSLESIIAKHPTLQNPNLINAVKSGTLNLLELSNKSYQEIVEALSPYISDPIALREASLELEGKQFLTRVKAGITFWIKKWGIGKNILTDQEIQQQTDNLIDALQNRKLEWQEQQREFKRFANILTGLELTDAELKKALEIADVLITTRSLPDFQTLPEDDPRIVKYAQAELSF
ncbi:MAG TPA: hypothetical protein P5150_07645, partial [Candidatus Ratteibacteria bacterium]|nr:hypothetical protein [Candidatus Ratteibacteria bacterium]